MGAVPLKEGHPLLGEGFNQLRGKNAPRGHFCPDQQPQAISPVKITRVLGFLMFSSAAEAKGKGELYIPPQRLIAGRAVYQPSGK